MLINELLRLDEKTVTSSWLADVTYMNFIKKKDATGRAEDEVADKKPKDRTPKKGDVKIVVKDGRSYTVKDVPYVLYRNWQKAESKGKFWHAFIRDKYTVV